MEETQEQHTIGPKEMSPEALHAWIVEELGDSELALRVGAHPELTEQYVQGEGYPTSDFFRMCRAIGKEDFGLAKELLEVAIHNNRLVPLSYDRVVGNISEDEKKSLLDRKRFFVTENLDKKIDSERHKTKQELASISYATERINEIRLGYGLSSLQIDSAQVRMLRDVQFSSGDIGLTSIMHQEIKEATGDLEDVQILATTFHELTHLMGYGSIQADQIEDEIHISSYRTGLSITNRQKDEKREDNNQRTSESSPKPEAQKYLRNLNEAVTEELSCRMLGTIPSNHPELGETVRAHRLKVYHLIKNDPEYLQRIQCRSHWITGVTRQNDKSFAERSYSEERNTMFNLFHKIVERNPEMFAEMSEEDSEEILFEILQKAMFTGNILPFGRLFNQTFGAGKFRKYGHLQTLEEQEEFISNL